MKTTTRNLLGIAAALLIAVFTTILSTVVHSEKQSPTEASSNLLEFRSSKVGWCVNDSCVLSTDVFFVFPKSAIKEVNNQADNSFKCFVSRSNKENLDAVVCGKLYKENDERKVSTTFKDKLNEVIAGIQANQ
ncbi:hypothetical protein E6W26_19395 [Pseudomonas aeruginosa]|uniref:hypothetical protein n=1 Tax=Pseudomonas aeruginosa TaxID=287 RepID=UPI00109E0F7B|nr:hypothetical protein [Pseudomonas aeruginosa]EKV1239514.1 hypothetical protein [Pseudomonas aeruginosa]EKV8587808.1 hypothetical protein [Pseudomonas aeruginosa]ELN5409870.1 hypothetical protein [Pseudomonas aeruginosa]ELP1434982.1 hypothetical protein [Pseudomonas aeruginosa]THB19472.1 hypothetical protein E6W26_19395 [Pseudomonas aeruginosa]